ncbi:MAG: thioredoxin domain-containing protein [Candidatus Micrarchaeota archaeon]|nr:thioredoxin domain-containing protein [Candidatus Micrarchaeota archaeon]
MKNLNLFYILAGVITMVLFIMIVGEILSDRVSQDALDSAKTKFTLNDDAKNCVTSQEANEYINRVFREAARYNVTGTPSFIINGGKIVGNQDLAVFENAIANPIGQPPRDLYQPDDITFGDPNSPVWIVEFSSPLCPHCQKFHQDKFKTLYDRYVRTGKVFWIFKGSSIFGRAQERELISMVYCANKYQSHDTLKILDGVFSR